MSLQRRELDGFDGFDEVIPADISKEEYEALVSIWSRLGGRRWKRGEKWKYSDACEWEGVIVRGGEKALAVPEMFVERKVIMEGGGEETSVSSVSGINTLASTSSSTEEPKRRRGDPRFSKNEKVLIKSRFGHEGIFEWREGDEMRPATIELVAVRGKGVKQEVEYDVRFTDGVVTSLDLGYNGLSGVLPHGLLDHFQHLTVLRLNGNELGGEIDVEILKAKARGTLEVQLADNSPGFNWPSNLHEIIEPPHVPKRGPAYLYERSRGHSGVDRSHSHSRGGQGHRRNGRLTPTSPQTSRVLSSPPSSPFAPGSPSSSNQSLPPGFPYRTKSRNNNGEYSNESKSRSVYDDAMVSTRSSSGRRSHSAHHGNGVSRESKLDDDDDDDATLTLSRLNLQVEGGGGAGYETGKSAENGFDYAAYDPELLKPLLVLNLARCSLVGPLSGGGGLGRLTSLTALILDDNRFTGPLPAQHLIQLKHLEILSLERNQLTGVLPASLCMLYDSLRVLRLGDNMLAGPLPSEWANLDKLQELVLGGNAEIDSLRDGWIATALENCLVTF